MIELFLLMFMGIAWLISCVIFVSWYKELKDELKKVWNNLKELHADHGRF